MTRNRFLAALLALGALLPIGARAQALNSPLVATRPANDNSNRAASTGYVDTALQPLLNTLNDKAPTANPTFTGRVTAPALSLTAPGSTGDLSSMSVAPSADAAAGTLAKVIAGKGAIDPLDPFPAAPTIARRFQAGVTLDSGAFTRASFASYIDARGSLVTVPPATPRFVADPATGENRGLLIEGAATNYLVNSAAPATQTASLNAGTYTLSVAGTGSAALSGGPTGTATQGAPVTFTLGAATSVTVTVSGSLARFQLEGGSFPTSFITTGAAPDTRAPDAYAYALPSSAWNTTEGTAVFDGYAAPASSGALQQAIEWGDGTANNRLLIARDGTRSATLTLVVGGTSYPITLGTPWPDGTRLRVAVAVGAGTMAASVNGSPVVTAPAPGLPPATRMLVGDGVIANSPFYGSILSAHYMPRRMANGALAALSAQGQRPSSELQALVAEKAPVASPTFTGKTTAAGRFEATVNMASPGDTFSLHNLYSVNSGPNTASGVGQVYISSATNGNFDVGYAGIYDFRGSHPTNQLSKLGQFLQVGSPATQTSNVGGAVAEWNLTNRGADTGYQASISSPNTYGGTVPYQQVGGLSLVPEANFSGAEGVGTNVTYGVMVSSSSNKANRLRDASNALDFSRTYTGYGSDRNSLVPSARGVGGEGGRFFSAWGGESAALAPSNVGQAWGFWSHGIDLARATFAGNDPIRLKTGTEIVFEDGSGTKVAGFTIGAAGQPRVVSASGTSTNLIGGAWTEYTPTYTPSGGSAGMTITNNRASYEIVGKTLRVQARFQVAWTGTAITSLQVSLPAGVTLKDGSAGTAVNISGGIPGYALGLPGGTSFLVGNGSVFGGSGSAITLSFTAEIN